MAGEREPSLREALDLLRRGMLPALAAAVFVGAAAYFLSQSRPTVYQAQATVVTTSQDPAQRAFGNTLVTAPALSTATYRAAALSRPVLQRALAILGTEPASDASLQLLQGSLTVRVEEAQTSALLRIGARAFDATVAQRRADAVANALVSWDVARATSSLEAIVDSLAAQIASIDDEIAVAAAGNVAGLERARADLSLQLSSARALRAGAVGRIELFEAAAVPNVPISPRPLRDAVAMALVAFLAMFGWVLLRAALDNRIRSLDDLAALSGLPMLVAFPRVSGGRRGLPREAASFLRTAIAFSTVDADPKVLQITSSVGGEGKTSVAIALAASFARQHYRTILVEADLRQPTIAAEFGIDAAVSGGIEAALRGAEPAPASVALEPGVEVDVLACFAAVPDPAELLSANVANLLHRLAARYDVVVVDSAPVVPVADALTIAPHTTGVVFVTSFADADRRTVLKASGLMRRLGIHLIGAVATKVPAGARVVSAFGLGYGDYPPPGSSTASTASTRQTGSDSRSRKTNAGVSIQ